jgi:hypothetical protein
LCSVWFLAARRSDRSERNRVAGNWNDRAPGLCLGTWTVPWHCLMCGGSTLQDDEATNAVWACTKSVASKTQEAGYVSTGGGGCINTKWFIIRKQRYSNATCRNIGVEICKGKVRSSAHLTPAATWHMQSSNGGVHVVPLPLPLPHTHRRLALHGQHRPNQLTYGLLTVSLPPCSVNRRMGATVCIATSKSVALEALKMGWDATVLRPHSNVNAGASNPCNLNPTNC